MEKAISINLGGMLFNIDEDAYEQLAAYLKSVNDHYRPGGEEIIKDIEVSIAEKFSVKVKSGCQIMAKADVEEVIKIMGTVEEFEQAGAEETANGKNGINAASRKLYRNADDVVIAGVCSGLAVYFGVDPLIIRLIFIVLALANGLGILIYIIFWLIVSKAATSVEKLEMRGAPANLKKIEEAVKKKSTQARELGRDALRSFRQNRSALFYRIIALPVKIIEVGALFIKKLFGAVGPVLLIFFGLLFIVSGLTAIVGLSTIASLVIFQVDSPYIVSDLPLAELARLPLYYAAVASVYLIVLIPVFFLFALGVTMVRRKNSFRLWPSLLLIVVWVVAIAVAAVAAAEIVPAVSSRLSDLNQAETEARAYEYRDFSKLYIGADMDVTVRRGDRFAIAMSGRARDLDRLNFRIEDGQLQILESRYPEPGKFCLFCFSRPVRADITLPALSSFVAFRTATVNLIGFESDLYISLGESARAELALNGQDIECRLSGVNSRLELSGPGGDLACSLDGYSRLTARELSADNININGSVFSRVSLDGETRTLTLELKDYARLEASDFTAGEVSAETDDFSQADVRPGSKLKAMAGGQSRIIYRGEPAALETDTADFGRIEAALDLKLDKNTLPDAGILTEPD